MSITTLAGFLASLRQTVVFSKVSTAGQATGMWVSLGLISGTPAAIPAIGNTANGLVPVAGDTGFPSLMSTTGDYLINWADWTSNNGIARIMIYDRLFHAGTFTTSDSITLASQPSYSSRVPGGTDFTGTQIWLEKINTVAGAATVTVTYMDQSGNTGATTGGVTNSVTANAIINCPLASGDSGVQKIESVVSSGGGAASTFNVVVVRPLIMLTANLDNGLVYSRFFTAGQKSPLIYSTSALATSVLNANSQATTIEVQLEIASG